MGGSTYRGGTQQTTWGSIVAANMLEGMGNAVSATGDNFITGMQLEVGSVATDFEHLSFADQLRRCQRYFEKSYRYEDAVGSTNNNDGNIDICLSSNNAGTVVYHLRFFEEKRTQPTVTVYRPDTGASGQVKYGTINVNSDHANTTIDSQSTKSCRVYFGIGSSWQAAFIQSHYTAEAEL